MSPDVIVVGAGVLGSATAHHLTRAGVRSILVLDTTAPGEGTTTAGAGFVSVWTAGYWPPPDRRGAALGEAYRSMQEYGIDFYTELAEQGADVDLRANGTLWMATTEAGYRRTVVPGTGHPLAPAGSHAVSPEEFGALWPTADPGAVLGGVYHPRGVQVSAGRTVPALLDPVRSPGVEVRTGVAVAELSHDRGRVTGVRTAAGETIGAGAVVLCAGAWTNALLRPLGWTLPMVPTIASRIVVPDLGAPPSLPTMLVPDLDGMWLRENAGGYTYGGIPGSCPLFRLQSGDAPRRPAFEEVASAAHDTLAGRLERLLPPLRGAAWTWTQGLPCYTPDGRLLCGPLPTLDGVWVAAGDNEGGVTHGPAMGRMLTEMIVGADPVVDAGAFRLDRFGPDEYPTPEAVEAHRERRLAARREAAAGLAGPAGTPA